MTCTGSYGFEITGGLSFPSKSTISISALLPGRDVGLEDVPETNPNMLFLSLLLLPVPLLLLPPIAAADPGSWGNSFSLGSTTPIGTPTPTGPDILTSSIPFSIAAVALGKYGFEGAAAGAGAEND